MMNPNRRSDNVLEWNCCNKSDPLPIESKSDVKKIIDTQVPTLSETSLEKSPVVNTVFYNEIVLDQNKQKVLLLKIFFYLIFLKCFFVSIKLVEY